MNSVRRAGLTSRTPSSDPNHRKDSPDDHGLPQALVRTPRPLRRHLDDRARHDDRERGAAVDQGRSRVLGDLAGVGRQRLPAHLRRLPAARWAARGSLRAPASIPDRDRAVHRRLDRVRSRRLAGVPDRRACGPGARWRDRLRGLALADDEPVHRAGRAREGDGRLRLRCCGRRQHRRAARRGAHRRPRLALDLPRQRADRRRRLRRLAQAAPDGSRRRVGGSGSTSPGRSPSRQR